jgi:phosphoenolpyruvate synthase/pyruvate phosphate dikinase
LGKKVKSFTAWLKTMKRLQPEPENISVKDAAVFSDSPVTALDSIEPILTESMAEVYLKQGLAEKAIEIYQKLSLQNPANSHIFASRISSIKENNI